MSPQDTHFVGFSSYYVFVISVHVFTYLSMRLSIYLFFSLSIYIFVYLSISIYVYLWMSSLGSLFSLQVQGQPSNVSSVLGEFSAHPDHTQEARKILPRTRKSHAKNIAGHLSKIVALEHHPRLFLLPLLRPHSLPHLPPRNTWPTSRLNCRNSRPHVITLRN